MIFLDRSRRTGPGRFIRLKVHLFFAGAAVLIAGMALNRDVLVLLAIGILAVGILLRFLGRSRAPDDADGIVGEEDGPEDDPPPPRIEEDRRRI